MPETTQERHKREAVRSTSWQTEDSVEVWRCDVLRARSAPTLSGREYLIAEMERRGWCNKDLVGIIGTRARVSEVLTGQRNLSIAMIRRLVFGHGLSAEKLIHNGEAGE